MGNDDLREKARNSVTPFRQWRKWFLANPEPDKVMVSFGCLGLIAGLWLSAVEWILTGVLVGGVLSTVSIWMPILYHARYRKGLAESVRQWMLINDLLPLMTGAGRKKAMGIYFSEQLRQHSEENLYIHLFSEGFASSDFRAEWEAMEDELVEARLKLWADQKQIS